MTLSLDKSMVARALLVSALMLMAATVVASNGDYGVNSGASAQRSSSCGGTGQPACSITMNGYTASFRTVDADGRIVYSFTFWCNLVIETDGSENLYGAECDQYLSDSS